MPQSDSPTGYASPACFAHELELGAFFDRTLAALSPRVKRAYRVARQSDGTRILVDRLWPRGMSKDRLRISEWIKDIAPSEELRRWFGHDPTRWQVFCEGYAKELDGKSETVAALRARASDETVTLVYAAKDKAHNNAVALRGYLNSKKGAR